MAGETEYFKSFNSEALELSKTLPEEKSELYKRHFVPFPFGPIAGMFEGKAGGKKEDAEVLNALSGVILGNMMVKFDAVVGGRSMLQTKGGQIKIGNAEDVVSNRMNRKMYKNSDDKLVALIHANTSNAVSISVPKDGSASLNILFTNADAALATQIFIDVGSGGHLNLFEWYASAGALHPNSQDSFLGAIHEIRVDSYASADVTLIHNEDENTHAVGFSKARILDNGLLRLNYMYNGGASTKAKNEVHAEGFSSRSDVTELVLGSKGQKFDLNTVIANDGVDTVSDLESKAALMDSSLCILKGFAEVGADAKGSLSFVNERGILLDKRAYISSIPGMSIKNSNVKATHSSATAPVDEDSLFYLMSRGADKMNAEKLLINGFLSGGIAKVQNPTARGAIASLINEKVNTKDFGTVPKLDTGGIWFDSPTGKEGDLFKGHYKYRDVR